MNHHRRLVVDLDDTISFTFNRDFENAEPNLPLIKKINSLYDSGWEIYIITARGQLSCNGNLEERKQKYQQQIKKWLEKNSVKYTLISFEKELATYYVDDKALTPEQFIDLEIKPMKAGWSGASIELRGNKVYKTQKDALSVVGWYKEASPFFNVPKVYSLIGDTICMEYIKPSSDQINYEDFILILERFKNLPTLIEGDFSDYVRRVESHKNSLSSIIRTKLSELNKDFQENGKIKHLLRPTFCHGDLAEDNMILSENGQIYLIDPIHKGWCSWLLDATKLLYSFRRDSKNLIYKRLKEHLIDTVGRKIVIVLEASQWVRVFNYAPEEIKPFIRKNFLDIMRNGT